MVQQMTVARLLDAERAVVSVERAGACGGDCHACQLCDAAGRTVTAVAKNLVGAQVGDVVKVQSASHAVLAAAALVYLAPLALFFIGYAVGTALPLPSVVWGGAGFALGIGLALVYHAHVRKKNKIAFEICEIVRRAE